MKEGERGPFSPKLRVRIKDNNSSPHGKFYRFLFPFSSKFSDLNFALYVLYTVSLGYLCTNCNKLQQPRSQGPLSSLGTRLQVATALPVYVAFLEPRILLVSRLCRFVVEMSGNEKNWLKTQLWPPCLRPE